jgi:hypothetical protein
MTGPLTRQRRADLRRVIGARRLVQHLARLEVDLQHALEVERHLATMVTLKGKSYRLRERAAANSDKPRRRPRPTELS